MLDFLLEPIAPMSFGLWLLILFVVFMAGCATGVFIIARRSPDW